MLQTRWNVFETLGLNQHNAVCFMIRYNELTGKQNKKNSKCGWDWEPTKKCK